MSETRPTCDRFDQWLLDGGTYLAPSGWGPHVDACVECRDQWHAHQMLGLTFAHEAVPILSPAFAVRLARSLAPTVTIRPLSGWRRAVLLAYGAVGVGGLGWALRAVPIPTIDLAAPWVPVASLIAVPLTLMLAIAVSRLIPGRRAPGALRLFAL